MAPVKEVSVDQASWFLTHGEGFGKVQYRKIKTSFYKQNVCSLPSYERLSQHWHSNILVEPKPIYEMGTDIINGIYFDPAEFLPKHMARWLERQELEGLPVLPGYYNVKFKVTRLRSALKVESYSSWRWSHKRVY